jgi:hypothetical protein
MTWGFFARAPTCTGGSNVGLTVCNARIARHLRFDYQRVALPSSLLSERLHYTYYLYI